MKKNYIDKKILIKKIKKKPREETREEKWKDPNIHKNVLELVLLSHTQPKFPWWNKQGCFHCKRMWFFLTQKK